MTDDSAKQMLREHSDLLTGRTPYRATFPQMPADTRKGKFSHVTMVRQHSWSQRHRIPSRLSNHPEIGFSMNRVNYRDSNT